MLVRQRLQNQARELAQQYLAYLGGELGPAEYLERIREMEALLDYGIPI